MADTEIKSVLSVDASGSVKTINELRAQIKELKTEMNEATVGSEEFTAAQKDLNEAQATLKVVLSGGAESMEDARSKTVAMAGSYNALVKELATLRTAWKATADEQERSNLGEQMMKVNQQLKEWDASVGNYQRNVGNYGSALDKLDEKLGKVGGAFETLTGITVPLKGGLSDIDASFKTLAANPILTAITAIIAVFTKLIEHIKSNEEQSQRLKEAWSGLAGMGELLKKVLDFLGDAIIKVVEWFSQGVEIVTKFIVKMTQGQAVADAYADKLNKVKDSVRALNEVERESRELSVESARVADQVADLRAKAADSEMYTAQERKKFLNEAFKLEQGLVAKEVELAQKELKALKDRNDINNSSKEALDKQAQAEEKVYKANEKLSNLQRTLQRQLNTINKEIKANADEVARVAQEQELTIQRLQEEAEKANAQALEENVKRRLSLLKEAGAEWSSEYESLLMQQIEMRTNADTKEAESTITDANILSERLNIIQEERLASIQDYYDRKKEIEETEALEAEARAQELAQKIEEALNGGEEEDSLEGMSVSGLRLHLQEIQEEIARTKEELSTMTQGEDESDTEFEARVDGIIDNLKKLQKETEDTEDKLEKRTKESKKFMQDYAKAVSGVMSTVAQGWMDSIQAKVEAGEMDEEEAKKEFERAKALQITATVINTIAGAIGAYLQASKAYTPPYAQILGAATAATVLASGYAQVEEIKRQTLSSSSSSSSSSVASSGTGTVSEQVVQIPGLSSGVETITLTNTASQEERLNAASSSQKVYVVESEIQAVSNKVQVVESEASW